MGHGAMVRYSLDLDMRQLIAIRWAGGVGDRGTAATMIAKYRQAARMAAEVDMGPGWCLAEFRGGGVGNRGDVLLFHLARRSESCTLVRSTWVGLPDTSRTFALAALFLFGPEGTPCHRVSNPVSFVPSNR